MNKESNSTIFTEYWLIDSAWRFDLYIPPKIPKRKIIIGKIFNIKNIFPLKKSLIKNNFSIKTDKVSKANRHGKNIPKDLSIVKWKQLVNTSKINMHTFIIPFLKLVILLTYINMKIIEVKIKIIHNKLKHLYNIRVFRAVIAHGKNDDFKVLINPPRLIISSP